MILLLHILPYVPIVVGALVMAALFVPEQHRGRRRRGVWRWIPC